MIVSECPHEIAAHVGAVRRSGRRIGCVPTMGALHEGHLSLVRAARAECDFVSLTLFVNPTQFGPGEDFTRYPRTLEADLEACRCEGVDLVFCPTPEVMYPAGFSTFVDVEGLTTVLEGAFRPGHFRGVTTVVLKLVNIMQPDAAFFGQKDYQQQLVIRQMCRDLNVPTAIVTCPTVREPDGLALSSRNRYLSPEDRQRALSLSRALRHAESRLQGGETDLAAVRQEMHAILNQQGATIDYVTLADPETLQEPDELQPEVVALIAARIGSTRLIDNLVIRSGGPAAP